MSPAQEGREWFHSCRPHLTTARPAPGGTRLPPTAGHGHPGRIGPTPIRNHHLPFRYHAWTARNLDWPRFNGLPPGPRRGSGGRGHVPTVVFATADTTRLLPRVGTPNLDRSVFTVLSSRRFRPRRALGKRRPGNLAKALLWGLVPGPPSAPVVDAALSRSFSTPGSSTQQPRLETWAASTCGICIWAVQRSGHLQPAPAEELTVVSRPRRVDRHPLQPGAV